MLLSLKNPIQNASKPNPASDQHPLHNILVKYPIPVPSLTQIHIEILPIHILMHLINTILLSPIFRDQIPFNGEILTLHSTRVEGPDSATVQEMSFLHPFFYTAILCGEGPGKGVQRELVGGRGDAG